MKVKLEDFLEEVNKRTTENNQYPVLTSSKNGLFLQDDYFNKQVASKDNTGYKIIQRGEFTYRAMSDTGEFFPNILDCANIGIVSPAYPVFKIAKDVALPEYLQYYFRSKSFQKSIASFIQGSTRASMKFDKMKTISINLPHKGTQSAIVKVLGLIKQQINKKSTMLHQLDTLIKARFVEMFYFKYPNIIVGDKFKTTSGGTPSKKHPEYYENGTIPWLTSGEINAGVIRTVKNKITKNAVSHSSAKIIPKNSVLVAMYGATAGQVGILKIPTTTNQAVCSILPDINYLPEYLYYAVADKKAWMIDQCAGGAQPNISQAIIRRMEVIDAPLSAQKEFVAFVAQVDKSKFAIQKSLEKTQQLFDSLMQEYFG